MKKSNFTLIGIMKVDIITVVRAYTIKEAIKIAKKRNFDEDDPYIGWVENSHGNEKPLNIKEKI